MLIEICNVFLLKEYVFCYSGHIFYTGKLSFIRLFSEIMNFHKSDLQYTTSPAITINLGFEMIKILCIKVLWQNTYLQKHRHQDIYFQNCRFVCLIAAITTLEVFILQSDDNLSNFHSKLNYFYYDLLFQSSFFWLKTCRFFFPSQATVFWQTNFCFTKHGV